MKAKKSVRPIREFWGDWEDKSHLLKYHPANLRGDMPMCAAHVNLVFSVQVSLEESAWGLITHLWVRRHDEKFPTWREMQRIKNELVGPERVAVEVYPAVSELVDQANMFHLWVLPEGFALPFSLKDKPVPA